LLALANLRQQQASVLAYFDCFWVFAVAMLLLVPLALAMRGSVAEKGSPLSRVAATNSNGVSSNTCR
jgi:MFS transporter, DHA2 family, multidrug resistance protein